MALMDDMLRATLPNVTLLLVRNIGARQYTFIHNISVRFHVSFFISSFRKTDDLIRFHLILPLRGGGFVPGWGTESLPVPPATLLGVHLALGLVFAPSLSTISVLPVFFQPPTTCHSPSSVAGQPLVGVA